jgi:hypothetical protein
MSCFRSRLEARSSTFSVDYIQDLIQSPSSCRSSKSFCKSYVSRLTIFTFSDRHSAKISRSPSTKREGQALTLNLKSGWDDMLDAKKAKGWGLLSKARSPSPYSPPSSPDQSNSGHSYPAFREDSAAMKSAACVGPSVTQTFNHTSTPSPVRLPSSSPQAPVRSNASGKPNPESTLRPPSAVIDDAASTTSSIWNAPWPEPPSVVPGPSRPRSASSGSSDTFGYPLYPSVSPPHTRSQPSQGHLLTVPRLPKQALSKRPSTKEARGQGGQNEVIYMTVVKEVSSE